jgi:hypothetical protein
MKFVYILTRSLPRLLTNCNIAIPGGHTAAHPASISTI